MGLVGGAGWRVGLVGGAGMLGEGDWWVEPDSGV